MGLLVSTGTRRGELLKTRWEDVNIACREIRLRHTKNGKERPALINELTMQVLTSMGAGTRKMGGLLFPNVTPAQVTVAFIRACQDAGVLDFSLHDLRHHYASMLRMNSVDLHTLQKLLRHSDPRMADRYAHLSQPFLLGAAKQLDGVLSWPGGRRSDGQDRYGKGVKSGEKTGFPRHNSVTEGFPQVALIFVKSLILFGVPDGI